MRLGKRFGGHDVKSNAGNLPRLHGPNKRLFVGDLGHRLAQDAIADDAKGRARQVTDRIVEVAELLRFKPSTSDDGFLASSASRLINGVTIPIDGGYTAT
jgi:NAD(P)-dependent dehydrogenase (short-subunit alcohol dehydrogenase family)